MVAVTRVLWRGALGGVLGGFVWLIFMYSKYQPDNAYNRTYLLMALLYSIPITAILGSAIGGVICGLHVKLGRNLGLLRRAGIGMVSATMIAAIYLALSGSNETPSSWMAYMTYLFSVGLTIGAFAGMMATPQDSQQRQIGLGSGLATVVWRGALGGIIGNFLKGVVVWVLYSFIYAKKPWGYLGESPGFIFTVLGIPLAAIMGAIVALMIRAIRARTDVNIGLIGRACIGGISVGTVGAFLYLTDLNMSADNLSSWMIVSLFFLDFGAIAGAVAGIMSRARVEDTFLRRERAGSNS